MCNAYVVKRSPEFRANQHLVTKETLTEEERQVLRRFERAFGDALSGPQETLVDRIRSGDVDMSRLASVRAEVTSSFEEYGGEITSVYRQYQEESLVTGRTVAANRYDLDGSFDQVPERLVEQLDEWSVESTDEVIDTMSDEVSNVLRRGAEDGMGTDDLAETLNDDVFEGRLKDSKAQEVARTELNSASSHGSHSAYEDADAVIAEEWLAVNQPNRTREAHLEANGQIVPVDGTFLVDGEQMDHPGDKSASAGNFVNCRCDVAPVMVADLSEEQLETIESGGRIMAGV